MSHYKNTFFHYLHPLENTIGVMVAMVAKQMFKR